MQTLLSLMDDIALFFALTSLFVISNHVED